MDKKNGKEGKCFRVMWVIKLRVYLYSHIIIPKKGENNFIDIFIVSVAQMNPFYRSLRL